MNDEKEIASAAASYENTDGKKNVIKMWIPNPKITRVEIRQLKRARSGAKGNLSKKTK